MEQNFKTMGRFAYLSETKMKWIKSRLPEQASTEMKRLKTNFYIRNKGIKELSPKKALELDDFTGEF